MKIIIKIPVDEFDIFLSKCADAWLEEAALLNTGVPFSHEVQGELVSITCERAEGYQTAQSGRVVVSRRRVY